MRRQDYRAPKTARLVKGDYNNPKEVKQPFGPAGSRRGGEKRLDFKHIQHKESRLYVEERMRSQWNCYLLR